jgi:PAS domain S-box-containing protein
MNPKKETTAGLVSSPSAVIRAHQERVLFERGRLFLWTMIAIVVGLWGLHASGLVTVASFSLSVLNSIELCVLVVALTQSRRSWYRRHVVGLSVALGAQLVAVTALYGLWTGDVWILSLRLAALNLVLAAVFPWGVAAQGVVVAASSLGFASVHWSLNGTVNHPSTVPTLALFAVSLPIAFWLKQAHAEIATEIERRRTAEGVLRHATEGANVAIWDADIRTGKVRLASGWDRLLGRYEDEITLVELLDLVHVDDRARTTASLQEHLQGRKSTHDIEHRIRHADGSYRWVLGRRVMTCDALGRPHRMQGVVIDISDRKRLEEALQDIEARKHVEEALRESEERYRGHFEQAAIGKAFCGLDGRYLRVNQRLCDIVGYSEPELCMRTFKDITHPDDLGRDLGNMRDMLDGKIQTHSMEKRYLRKDGSIVWVDVTVSLVREPSGQPKYFISVIEDIEARKRAESERERLFVEREQAAAALRASEERLRLITETIEEVFWMADVELAHIFYVSPAYARISGRTRESLYQTPRSFIDDIHPEDRERVLADVAIGRSGPPFDTEYRIIRPDGSIRWIWNRGFPVPERGGQISRYVGIAQDITERKQTEAALRASKDHFRALIENSSDVTLVVDKDGTVTYASPSLERVLGYKPEEAIGRSGFDTIVPADIPRAISDFGKAILTKEVNIPNAFRVRHKDGSERILEGVGRNLLDDPAVAGFIMNVRDVTERKRAETQLLQTNTLLDSIVENIPNTMFVKDAKRLTYVLLNRATEDLFGHRRADVIDKNDYDLFPKEDADAFAKQDRSVLHNKALLDIPEEPVKTAQRGERIMHTKKIPILNDKGELAYILGIQEDITDRHQAEQMQRRHERETATINNILRAINTHLDVKAAFPEVCAGLQELARCAAVCLSLFDERREWLSFAASNTPWALLGAGPGTRLHVTEWPGATDVLAGRPHIIPDLKTVLQFPIAEVNYAFGFRSVVNLPLCAGSNVIGLLDLFWREVDGCRRVETGTFTQVANAVAIAVEKSRLFEQVSAGRERLAVLSRRLLEVQEAERQHLARELHDEIGQYLTGINLLLGGVEDLSVEDAVARLKEARGLVDGLIVRVRDVSLDLRPAMLDDFGVLPALSWLFGRYTAQTGITVAFEHRALQQRFPAEQETAVYRIVQEALTNVARHAAVHSVNVEAWADGDVLRVSITDQGGGFDGDAVLANGMTGGLAGMRERAMLLGGRLTVESKPGTGTRLIAELPLRSEPGSPDTTPKSCEN